MKTPVEDAWHNFVTSVMKKSLPPSIFQNQTLMSVMRGAFIGGVTAGMFGNIDKGAAAAELREVIRSPYTSKGN